MSDTTNHHMVEPVSNSHAAAETSDNSSRPLTEAGGVQLVGDSHNGSNSKHGSAPSDLTCPNIESVEHYWNAALLKPLHRYSSFDYEALVSMHSGERCYYVTIHYKDRLWRAKKTADRDTAVTEFRSTVERILRLVEQDIQEMEMSATQTRLEWELSQAQLQIERLNHDMQRNAEVRQEIAEKRHKMHAEMSRAKNLHNSTHAQLSRVQRSILELERVKAKETRKIQVEMG